jgi:hypothetical protein
MNDRIKKFTTLKDAGHLGYLFVNVMVIFNVSLKKTGCQEVSKIQQGQDKVQW